MSPLLKLDRKQNNASNVFPVLIFLFRSYSFGIETITVGSYALILLLKSIPIPVQNRQSVYPFSSQRGPKTISFGGGTYLYLPRGVNVDKWNMTFYLECPTQKTGLAGWNVNATHNFLCLPLNSFRRTWNFNSEKVVLSSRWKPCFHEASPVSGYLADLSVPLKERKDGTPFKWNTFFIDGHFTEISNFQFPKVAYHLLKVSGEKSGRKVNDTGLFGSFRQKISGSNETHLIR